ncbi:hypothetical protein [Spiroplasma melliferum]|uniref:Uncharacterized protein n=2 Tax=Spiroplasma melliferum TaxID=2134 RepID=A0AAI9T3F5_SPIME|nr:hypothetical protein [Spiroplasma melliferum]KAI92773.1 hypothetical protein SPM_001810 [Spiroplasma melliferum KC3]
MSENKNHKIESYYNHDDAYPHLKHERKQHQKENEKIIFENNNKNNKNKSPLTSLCEVISPLYGKKLDGADEFKTNMSHSSKQQKENKPITSIKDVIDQQVSEKKAELAKMYVVEEHPVHLESTSIKDVIDQQVSEKKAELAKMYVVEEHPVHLESTSIKDVIDQQVSEKKAELAKIHITEEKIPSLDKTKIEPYFRKYDPVTNKEIIPSTLKTKNKLSEPTAQTVSFLLKPRKSGTNIFGDRTAELKVELEQIKEKIRNPMPEQNADAYEQTAMFEGIEEQREINEQIRKAVAEAYHIDDNFSEDMPLEQRCRLIQHNSTKAGAVRFKTLLNLQENNLNNQFLRRPKPLSQNTSGYHKKLHDLRNSDSEPEMEHVKEYHTNRNPYLSRMLEIEEQTAKEAEAKRRERIKTQINDIQTDNKNNNE